MVAEALVLLGAYAAYKDNFLTVSQMTKSGVDEGLPFIAHLGMWGDLILVSPMIAFIWNAAFDQWTLMQIVIAFGIGAVVSLVMHFFYSQSPFPESHVFGKRLTVAGWIHMIYMGLALGILILFFFSTKENIPVWVIRFVVIGLGVHIVLGTHCLVGMLNFDWYREKPQTKWTTWLTIIVVWLLLTWRSHKMLQYVQ